MPTAKGFPYPSDTDPVDVPGDIQALAEAVDTELDDYLTAAAAGAAYAPLAATVNAKTGNYTLVAGDSGEVITMDVAGANTLTVPTGLAAGFTCVIVQLGAGQTTITASGTTLRSTPGLKLRTQYSVATLIHLGSNVWSVSGDLVA